MITRKNPQSTELFFYRVEPKNNFILTANHETKEKIAIVGIAFYPTLSSIQFRRIRNIFVTYWPEKRSRYQDTLDYNDILKDLTIEFSDEADKLEYLDFEFESMKSSLRLKTKEIYVNEKDGYLYSKNAIPHDSKKFSLFPK